MRTRIVGSLFLLVALAAVAGEVPITLEEARTYMATFPEDAAADLVKLDTIELAVPVATVPGPTVWVLGRDVVVTWTQPVTVDVAGGALRYEVKLPEVVAKKIVPQTSPWSAVGWVATGVILGFTTGLIVGMSLHAP